MPDARPLADAARLLREEATFARNAAGGADAWGAPEEAVAYHRRRAGELDAAAARVEALRDPAGEDLDRCAGALAAVFMARMSGQGPAAVARWRERGRDCASEWLPETRAVLAALFGDGS